MIQALSSCAPACKRAGVLAVAWVSLSIFACSANEQSPGGGSSDAGATDSGGSSGNGSSGGSGSSGSSGGSGSGSGSSSSGSNSDSGNAPGVDVPGPSQALFNSPYYQCVHDYYVSTTGNDSNAGTQALPWLTLQHADSTNVGPGSCIHVAPGTYDGLIVHNGGNAATATGYVVYRCQTLDGCTITGNTGQNGNASVWFDTTNISANKPNTVNYVQFDGFQLKANGTPANQGPYGVGFVAYNCNLSVCNGPEVASHHVWLLNSIVSGFDQGGVAVGAGDYYYAIHNTSLNNALSQCDAQGSGIAINIAHDVPGYVPTPDDQDPYSGFGFPTWKLGDGTFFHVVFAYNVTYNNHISGCGAGNVTDGNGIIFDTNAGPDGNSTDYHNPMLAYGNISYNNGGGGVHVFASFNVTVANNTAFNNYIDPELNGGSGVIDDNAGGNADNGTTYLNYFYNNIAVSCTSATPKLSLGGPDALMMGPTMGDDPAKGNVSYMVTNSANCGAEIQHYNAQTYDMAANKTGTNPLWVNVTFGSPGTDATQPAGTNFALSAGSPAIGYGAVKAWMPATAVDSGACPHSLTTCP